MINLQKLKHFNMAASEGYPDKILKELSIKPGSSIGDIGSGGGYYTLRFADLVGSSGTVFAVDVEKDNLEFVEKKVKKEYFTKLKKCLKEEGQIVIIDHKKDHKSGPGIGHGTGEGEIEYVLKAAGFTEHLTFSFLSGQWFFVFKS